MADIELETFDETRHKVLIVKWLWQPHVRATWGDPEKNLADVLDAASHSGQVVIKVDDKPVGYIHWQPITCQTLADAGILVEDDQTADIDIFIGETQQIGQGIGTAAITQLIKRLGEEGETKRATLFTGVENAMAIRAYEKAGFKRMNRYKDTDGWTWVLMKQIIHDGVQ